MDEVVKSACEGLPVSPQMVTEWATKLRDAFVLTKTDVAEVTDVQFANLGIPVGVANRLRRTCKDTVPAAEARVAPPHSVAANHQKERHSWPCMRAIENFQREILPSLAVVPREVKAGRAPITLVPIGCLRWSQATIHGQMEFVLGGYTRGSIYKMLDDLLRGCIRPESVEPLEVVKVKQGKQIGLFSESNGRLVALLAYQCMHRDQSFDVRCIVRPDDERFRERCQSLMGGWSVSVSAGGVAHHLGSPLFPVAREQPAAKSVPEPARKRPRVMSEEQALRNRIRQLDPKIPDYMHDFREETTQSADWMCLPDDKKRNNLDGELDAYFGNTEVQTKVELPEEAELPAELPEVDSPGAELIEG
eukprot:gnl/TRDRNA2_/TRDRNA2_129644_c0_seq1.p1 gnl/TRDRNA2_/TRDRNA2_129644_c0~~gnl/TRDRNA2_/TRDRNA2_129644_c0_seq1.p1  ORF type:complete len:362 (-),score=60.58 gnl/TRDRNA2_/TRDRNA2_129644_c0_seq1:40-1125(-)